MRHTVGRNSCLAVISALLLAASCTGPTTGSREPAAVATPATDAADVPKFDSAFWSHWGDGKAELAGYDLTYPRYNELRSGVAVTIFVTETFSNSLRVKADPGEHPASDEFPVMKLNLIQDFQTGIYDYNNMLSSFVALAPVNGRPAGSITKASFSSQEWCGHVYDQALFDATSVRTSLHSYFDGEADQRREIEYPPDGISEDALLFTVRGFARPVLAPGETRTVRVLRSLQSSREAHVPLAWKSALISRSDTSQTVTVPAGTFEVELWWVEPAAGVKKTFYVEKSAPHRIVRWESNIGERATLLGVKRLEYWKMNNKGGEEALRELGLLPRPPRTS